MRLWRRNRINTLQDEGLTPRIPELHAEPSSRPPPTQNQFLQRGDELLNEGDYPNAVFMYSEALRQDRGNASLFLKLSLARLLQSPPQLDQALQDVNSAIQITPSLGQAWKQKGHVCMRMGDFRAAEEALIHAIGLLQGWDRVQAQQALADARSRHATQTALPRPPTIANELPVHPRVQPTTNNTNRTTPAVIQNPPTQLNPPTQAAPTPPLQTPAAAPAPAPTAPAAGIPSPNTLAQGEMLAQQLDIPTEAPPQYTATPLLPTGLASGANSDHSLVSLRDAIVRRKQGSLYLRPFTAEGQIDSIQLLFHGKTYIQSILLDLPPQIQVHPAWKKYHVDVISFPSTTFLDLDCESAASHEGNSLGTTSVLGYAEEYREHQLALQPQLSLFLEAQTIPPVMSIAKIVERLQLLRTQSDLEDNVKLAEILGTSSVYALSTTRQISIENICMLFHRGQYAAPTRFIDFLTTQSFARHVFGAGEGIGLTNFLFHILLGAELYIRLKKAGRGSRYTGIMTNTTSALVLIAQQWMENVTIRVLPPAPGAGLLAPNRHTLVADNHTRQSEGLIRFAEALAWPYLDEVRQNIESVYTSMIANPANVHHYLKDWLYGLCLPGKYFRHRIMSCLVLASPSIKHISTAPYYDDGIVVGNKSYWPKRSVLGRVLGGLRNPVSVCGWIGPVPAPVGIPTGWIHLNARRVTFTTPVFDDLTEGNLEILGFSTGEAAADPEGIVRDLSDLSQWNPPANLPPRLPPAISNTGTATGAATVKLDAIRLNEVTATGITTTITTTTAPTTRQYRANLDFLIHGTRTTLTLYANPLFVHVPQCAGSTHPIHARLVQKHFTNVVHAKDLKSGVSLPSVEALMIIDATQSGEEALARAWCAESGRHAVVRKRGTGCFVCSVNLAGKRTGLGFGVLIWC